MTHNISAITPTIWSVVLQNTVGPDSIWFWAAVQAIAISVSLLLIYGQVRVAARASMLTAIDGLSSKWSSLRMLAMRVSVLERYQDESRRASVLADVATNSLLLFFEETGLLVHLRIIDKNVVWERLSFTITNYWYVLEPTIRELRVRENDKSFYDKFETLALTMSALDKKKGAPHGGKSVAQVCQFAREEVDVCKLRMKVESAQPESTPSLMAGKT